MTIAQLATIPSRAKILPRVIASLIDQVDIINVALAVDVDDDMANHLPFYLQHEKIWVTMHDNSLQDGAKWINAPTDPGHFVLVCDDDIEYPANYAEKMRQALAQTGWRTIISCMGKKLRSRPVTSYFKSETICLKTFEEALSFYSVEIPGSCAMAYHTDFVRISQSDIKTVNSDLAIAAFAKKNGIPCYVIPHRADWLTNLMPLLPVNTPNLFDQFKNNDERLVKFINENL